MFRRKKLTVIVLLVFTAVLLQAVPDMAGFNFKYISLLSGLPIYIISRISPGHGFAAYAAVGFAISLANLSEGILFLFLNGILGLSSGLLSAAVESKAAMSAFMAALVAAMLTMLNYVFGVRIFDYTIISSPALQSLSLFFLLFPFCLVYLHTASYLYTSFRKSFFIL